MDRGSRVLILTADQTPHVLGECLEAGASGVFDKVQNLDHLVHLISDAAAGRTVMSPEAQNDLLASLREHRACRRSSSEAFSHLTHRETEVLGLLMAGQGVEHVAAHQQVSIATVRTQVRSILQKLGVNSQLAAVALAHSAGWAPPGT